MVTKAMTMGDRVVVKFSDGREEGGTVAYVRYDGCNPSAVSVQLDSRLGAPGYAGTIFNPAAVRATVRR